MAGEEDKGKNRRRKTTRALKKAISPGEVSLDNFLSVKPDEPQLKSIGAQPEKKPRKRRAKTELDREWRVKNIEKEHKLDGKSKTINLQRSFLTKLRVSQEVWEEVRARTLENLCKWAAEAEERALKKGRKTIILEDCI